MAFLAFILDLRTLSPQFLKLIKDSLLQFANLFVLSSLNDRIALCYLQSESELKVAYSPESFNLLDWHDAVNALSCCYAPHLLERTTLPKDGNLALILNDRMLVSARRKETKGKIILIGACIQSKVDSTVILPAHGYHQMLNSTTIDEDTLLEEESRSCEKLKEAPGAVRFDVIGSTGLTSLDKGLVIGRPYWVIPEESSHVIAFEKLCYTLAIKQLGLICRGPFNLDTMNFFSMPHFYLLEPCVGGRMVLKRLAGAEETIPCPKFPEFPSRLLLDGAIGIPADNSMLENVDSMEYEGKLGFFHEKLNLLIKNRKHGDGCVCCGSDGGGLIHVDEIHRTKLT